MKKVLTVLGARPQFVKAAAVSRAFAEHGEFDERIVHTGQHFDADMSDIFFRQLEIPNPVYNLEISGVAHGAMTGRMLEKLETIMLDEVPDIVMIYGDTNSTLAGALAAVKLHIPVAHVEAGLRSYNRNMPEEINRILSDHVSALLLCPTQASIKALAQEGITRGVHNVGDVMFDATLFAVEKAKFESDVIARMQLEGCQYALATIHRAENTDSEDCLRAVFAWLNARTKDLQVLLPLHPRTRGAIARYGMDTGAVRCCDPVGYIDMAMLLSHASAVYTDSGGLQKEAYFHRKPCVTLRTETEWVETIDAGWNRLWRGEDYRPRMNIDEYGDGHASQKVAAVIAGFLDDQKTD